GVANAQDTEGGRQGFEISLRLVTIRFRLLQVFLSYGVVRVKIVGSLEILIGQIEGSSRFHEGGTLEGVIGAGDIEHGLTGTNVVSWRDDDPAHRAAGLADHRCRLESVVSNRTGKAKHAVQTHGRDGYDVNMAHLFGCDREEFGLGCGVLSARRGGANGSL